MAILKSTQVLGYIAATGTVTGSNLSGTNTGDQVGDGTTITGTGKVGSPFVSTGATTTYVQSASANAYNAANTYSNQRWIDTNRYGFVNPYNTVSIAFDGTDTFTLTDVASAGWSYYRAGLKYTISGNKTVKVATPMVDNTMYFIFIDATDGTLSSSTSSWTLNDTKVPVATIKWDSANTPKYIMSYECHTCGVDRAYHREHHFADGTEYVSGGVPSGYTPASTNDADKVFAISAGTIADEDLFLIQSALTKPDGATAVYPIVYRVSTTRYSWYLSDMPFKYGGTPPSSYTYIEYDAAGSSTASTNNRWVNTYLFLSNVQANNEVTGGTSTSDYRFFIVQGRGSFSSLALAQGESFASFDLTGFPVAEGIAVYQLTWNTGGVNNSVKGRCTLAAVTRINSNIITTSAIVSTNHNTLSGLQGGQAGEYFHLTNTEYVTATTAAGSASNGYLTTDDWNVFNNKMKAGENSVTYSATANLDWSTNATKYCVLTDNLYLTMSNPINGHVYRLRLEQGGSGGYLLTLPGVLWKGGSAPTLTTTIGKSDWITLVYSNGVYYADASLNF